MTSGVDLALEKISTELRTLHEQITELRKQGLYTKFAELKAMNIPDKITYAQITQDFQDVKLINGMMNEVKSELVDVRKTAEAEKEFLRTLVFGLDDVEVKKEEIAQPSQPHAQTEDQPANQQNSNEQQSSQQAKIIQRTTLLVQEANQYIAQNDFQNALQRYGEIRGIYNLLPKTMKKDVFQDCQEIYAKILKSGTVKEVSSQTAQPQQKRRFRLFRRSAS